ncbi:MAG: hypothetical protein ACREQ3_23250, partial [Candidatus Binatia bacterium]
TSLVPFDGRQYHDHIFAEFGRPHYMLKRLHARFSGHDFSAFDRGLQCVRTKTHKLIAGSDGTEELYDLGADPGEDHNRLHELPGVAGDLRTRLTRWRASVDTTFQGQQAVENAATVKALRALGYF